MQAGLAHGAGAVGRNKDDTIDLVFIIITLN